ncbi:DUF6193 family natural product biosynthesis protein [Streptomyces sp. NPDC037389]|uniref:DUF6193 family natural product biosynthesis protein n=1 Tax=Streptomyces sp. NPDC037389 TaxID=3155369 RepID=UPI0033D6B2EE
MGCSVHLAFGRRAAARRGYHVLGPSRSERVGMATSAEQAVAMVVERLPANCGPAFVGTSEELAAYESPSHR